MILKSPILFGMLQWGHGLAAVDGSIRRRRHDQVDASMGPRPCGRGWRAGAPDHEQQHAASMGPRPCGRGWRVCRRTSEMPLKASMGPRPCGRGWRAKVQPGQVDFRVLQWGHGLAAVDGCPAARRARVPAQLQWGHGLAAVDGPSRLKVGIPAHGLQWGHGLAAVDGWPARCTSSKSSSFNGATALRPWMEGARRRRLTGQRRLQWGHGLAAVDGIGLDDLPELWRGFNGATALRPWMDRGGRRRRRAGLCFNGATALRPWMVARRVRACSSATMLQWGHGLAAVDGRRRPPLAPRSPASMGPRPCGRGWRRRRYLCGKPMPASMGPRPCGRGWRTGG